MDRRREPRFQVRSSIRVFALRDQERELKCLLVEISGMGMRIVADECLLAGEIIVAETDEHLILAEVRNSHPRGDKHVLGVQRVHSVLKDSLPQESARIEQTELLIKALCSRVQAGLGGASESLHEPFQGEVQEQALKAAAERILAEWERLTTGSDRDTTSAQVLESVERASEIKTDGNSVPVFAVRHSSTTDGQNNIPGRVEFLLSLMGNEPLRDLIVRLVRVTAYDSKNGAVGPVIFHQRFTTFSSQGEDWKARSGPHDLKGDHAVFQATFAARNGEWKQIIKMRRVNSVWESRSVVFVDFGASYPIRQISDEVSQNFPEAERRIPIVPVTAEDFDEM